MLKMKRETAKDPTRKPIRSRKTKGRRDVSAAPHLHPPLSTFPSIPGVSEQPWVGCHNSSRPCITLSHGHRVGVRRMQPRGAAWTSLKQLERRPRRGRGRQKELRPFSSREGWISGEETLLFQLCVELKLLFQGAQTAASRFCPWWGHALSWSKDPERSS